MKNLYKFESDDETTKLKHAFIRR